jgi:hypothetical protein
VEVVDRDLERALGCAEEVGEGVRDLLGGLTAVYERARLYARFCSW